MRIFKMLSSFNQRLLTRITDEPNLSEFTRKFLPAEMCHKAQT